MIKGFKDSETEEIWDNLPSKRSRRRLPMDLWPIAQQKLDALEAADTVDDLRHPPGNRLEPLKGDRKGSFSIRINDRYRICFQFSGQDAGEVEIVDYHSG